MLLCVCLFTGFISDVTGNCDLTFYISGCIIFVSGFMLIAIPCLSKHDRISNYFAPRGSSPPTRAEVEAPAREDLPDITVTRVT